MFAEASQPDFIYFFFMIILFLSTILLHYTHYILGGLPECLEFPIEATGEVSVA